MRLSRIKLYIKILLGREMYFPRQIKVNTIELGDEGGSFPVLEDSIRKEAPLLVYSFGVGEDLSFSESILKKNAQAKICAFDPTPKAIRYAQEHTISKNDRFTFLPWGISDKNGTEQFYLPKNEAYVSGSVVQYEGVNKDNSIEVEMKTLSTIMDELHHSHIDILKMDIEGSEFQVIPQILESGCDISQLCIEVHQRFFPEGKKKVKAMIKDLNDHGYFIAEVLDSGQELLFVKK